MDIGEKLKSLRKGKKLTQEQLAESLHVSAQAVSKWETGASCPDVDMLPRLAVFFQTTVDELLDFDRRRIDAEVAAIVEQSVPLRKDPAEAEAFYRRALEKYPNNEVLLNCLLMMIPNDRSQEKIEIAQRLLDFTADDEIKYDVLRLLALTYHGIGESAMAEACVARIPELYFMKTEIAAAIRTGEAQEKEIRKTEEVSLWTFTAMLALRGKSVQNKGRYDDLVQNMTALLRGCPEFRDLADGIVSGWEKGALLAFYE